MAFGRSTPVRNQAAFHWSEFALIVASGNIALGLGAAGFLVTGSRSASAASVAVLMASAMAVIIAYYSIQVGSLLDVGAIPLSQVVGSFIIATAEASMFLWTAFVLSRQPDQLDGGFYLSPRHWTLFFAVFAIAAGVANREGAWQRRRSGVLGGPLGADFERIQREDAIGATLSGCISFVLWTLTLKYRDYAFIFLPSVLALLGMSRAINNQHRCAVLLNRVFLA